MYNSTVPHWRTATDLSRYASGYSSLASLPASPSWSEIQKTFWKLGQGLGHMQRFWIDMDSKLQPGVRFSLTVLLTIAAANSCFILVSPPSLLIRRSEGKAMMEPFSQSCSCCCAFISSIWPASAVYPITPDFSHIFIFRMFIFITLLGLLPLKLFICRS